jgi:hypothetical protein
MKSDEYFSIYGFGFGPERRDGMNLFLQAIWPHKQVSKKPTVLQRRGVPMRLQHMTAIITLVLIGFGVKLFLFPAPAAEANTNIGRNIGIDVSEMHKNLNLPEQKLHDMTFVFSDAD